MSGILFTMPAPLTIQKVKVAQYGHLLVVPAWANDVRSPVTGKFWRVLYGMCSHKSGTESQVYIGPKNSPTEGYLQLIYSPPDNRTTFLNFWRINDEILESQQATSSFCEAIMDSSMMVTHRGAAWPDAYVKMVVWEWKMDSETHDW